MDEPTKATILSGENLPFNIVLPIIAKSGRFKVQTISPLLIGETLLMIVLRLPAGCGPKTL